jgi:hypothetical protein
MAAIAATVLASKNVNQSQSVLAGCVSMVSVTVPDGVVVVEVVVVVSYSPNPVQDHQKPKARSQNKATRTTANKKTAHNADRDLQLKIHLQLCC